MRTVNKNAEYVRPESEVIAGVECRLDIMRSRNMNQSAKDAGDWQTETEDDWSNPDDFGW